MLTGFYYNWNNFVSENINEGKIGKEGAATIHLWFDKYD